MKLLCGKWLVAIKLHATWLAGSILFGVWSLYWLHMAWTKAPSLPFYTVVGQYGIACFCGTLAVSAVAFTVICRGVLGDRRAMDDMALDEDSNYPPEIVRYSETAVLAIERKFAGGSLSLEIRRKMKRVILAQYVPEGESGAAP